MDIRFRFSIHICSKREYFDTFQEKKTYFVSLGDRFTCDVTGVGIVEIKMFDGVVHTLGGVAYVLKM